MELDFGYGWYTEPKHDPRDSEWHKQIVRVRPVTGSRKGHMLYLSCGHRCMAHGDLLEAAGVVLCRECRDMALPDMTVRELKTRR